MSEDYWEGAIWVFQARILNDGSNAGDHVYAVSPGVGNELEVLYGNIINSDSGSARNASIDIDDGSNLLTRVLTLSTPVANADVSFFSAPGNASSGNSLVGITSGKIMIAGGMRLVATVFALAVNQDSFFAIACRIRGGLPTVTFTSPTDATETVNPNQVF